MDQSCPPQVQPRAGSTGAFKQCCWKSTGSNVQLRRGRRCPHADISVGGQDQAVTDTIVEKQFSRAFTIAAAGTPNGPVVSAVGSILQVHPGPERITALENHLLEHSIADHVQVGLWLVSPHASIAVGCQHQAITQLVRNEKFSPPFMVAAAGTADAPIAPP